MRLYSGLRGHCRINLHRVNPTRPLCLRKPASLYSQYGTAASPSAAAAVNGSAAEDVAVLGGGITGLAAAYYVAKYRPKARISIFEAAPRLGGWLQSKSVEVAGGRVLFEQGPRSLRAGAASSAVTNHLIQDLGLIKDTVVTARDSPAAANRYVYYPDRLVQMPGPGTNIFSFLFTALRNPVFAGVIPGFFNDLRTPKRDDSLADETVESFISRRFDPRIADNLASAVLHGIYAGDVAQLSVKSLLPLAWHTESFHGNVIAGAARMNARGEVFLQRREVELEKEVGKQMLDPEFEKKIATASIFSLRSGLQSLAERLRESLEANPNVTIRAGTRVQDIKLDESGKHVLIRDDKGESPGSFKHLISTIFAKSLSKLCVDQRGNTILPSLSHMHAVTVMVVNLYYRTPRLLSIQGFGYLIPRSVPFEQNPERALGVIFDSDAVGGQDTADGTKLTVMLGGHWWDDWAGYPSDEEGVEMAKSVLRRHLGVTEEPEAAVATLQRDCIPQYTLGHEARLKTAHLHLKEAYKGRVRVAGNSYGGVGVHDCLKGALDVARNLYDREVEDRTGLEYLMDERDRLLVGLRKKSEDD